jgi:hypothetical protein
LCNYDIPALCWVLAVQQDTDTLHIQTITWPFALDNHKMLTITLAFWSHCMSMRSEAGFLCLGHK